MQIFLINFIFQPEKFASLLPSSFAQSELMFYIIVFSKTGTNTFRLSILYSDSQSKLLPIILEIIENLLKKVQKREKEAKKHAFHL
jgi:hypothetical protein